MIKLIHTQVESLTDLVIKRHNIYLARQREESWPWTDDKILQTYRFPNMYRELDKVTLWITNNWREPNSDHVDIWFALTVARMVNWPETLEEIRFPIPWDQDRFLSILNERARDKKKVFTGAYIIPSGREKSKPVYVSKTLSKLWKNRRQIRPTSRTSLEEFYQTLIEQDGIGTFMAGQIIADTKYTPRLRKAKDWWSWASMGPGSCRGLNRIVGRPTNSSWEPYIWLKLINQLRKTVTPILLDLGFPKPHAQDTQGFCCEFDKYERTRLGEGRPRSKYYPPRDER